MKDKLSRSLLRSAGLAFALTTGLGLEAQSTQTPPSPTAKPTGEQPAPAAPKAQTEQTPPNPQTSQQRDIFRSRVDVVTTDVIVRDGKGQFVADLKKDDFEVYEDGVKQEVISFVLSHGGRTYNELAPAAPPVQEGIILPPTRPTNDAAGRIFLIFVDDLHLDFRNTGRIKDLFKKISKELVHDGDMFGIVSTGPSSLAIDLTYDHKRLDQAIEKISGAGLSPKDIIDVPEGAQGPPEVRYRAHVAFSTAYDIMGKLEQVHNRRKAFIYVSNGYDFNPFSTSRERAGAERMGMTCDNTVPGQANCSYPKSDGGSDSSNSSDPNPFLKQGNEFADADLVSELSYLTRAANRANASIYTIDPRGLVGGPDLDENIDQVEWQDYIRKSQDSLRVLAEQTGGLAVVNQNDFNKALKRIDNETSDYYVIGYYSSNPDPTKRRRRIDVKVNRPNVNVQHRTEYTLKSPPKPVTPSK
jgi:VWFA-related protein